MERDPWHVWTPQEIKERLHRMIDEMDELQAAVAHDYLLWWTTRGQEAELTPEEEAMVEHDLAMLRRRWDADLWGGPPPDDEEDDDQPASQWRILWP